MDFVAPEQFVDLNDIKNKRIDYDKEADDLLLKLRTSNFGYFPSCFSSNF